MDTKNGLDVSSSTYTRSKGRKADAGPTDPVITAIQELWSRPILNGLEVRHKTGLLLNERLGSPEQRCNDGARVIKQCSNKISQSESELLLMRRFAHHFKSIEAMVVSDPCLKTWKQVKDALIQSQQNSNKTLDHREKSPAIDSLESVDLVIKTLAQVEQVLSNVKPYHDLGHRVAQAMNQFIDVYEAQYRERFIRTQTVEVVIMRPQEKPQTGLLTVRSVNPWRGMAPTIRSSKSLNSAPIPDSSSTKQP